jgi:hypothetical protein
MYTLILCIVVLFTSASLAQVYPVVSWPSNVYYTSCSYVNSQTQLGYFTSWDTATDSIIFEVNLTSFTIRRQTVVSNIPNLNAFSVNPSTNIGLLGGYSSQLVIEFNLTSMAPTGRTINLRSISGITASNFPGTYSSKYHSLTNSHYVGGGYKAGATQTAIVKINAATFTYTAHLLTPLNQFDVYYMMLDTVRNKLIFSLETSYIGQISLNTFTLDPVSLTIYVSNWGVVDSQNGFAYVANVVPQGSLSTISKINLSTFTVVSSILITAPAIGSGVIDSANKIAFFGAAPFYKKNVVPQCGRVSRINLTTFTETLPAITLPCTPYTRCGAGVVIGLYTADIDLSRKTVYWGVDTCPGSAVKMPY